MEQDAVDRIIAQWVERRPELDHSPLAVVGRINLLSHYLSEGLERTFAAHGITSGGFDVLASLRRSGPPFQLSPTQLFNALLISSGAMTHRIDRLEAIGLAERLPDPQDRRGLLIGLTPKGRELVDTAIVAHRASEERLISALTATEREVLAGLLRKLVLSLAEDKSSRATGQ